MSKSSVPYGSQQLPDATTFAMLIPECCSFEVLVARART